MYLFWIKTCCWNGGHFSLGGKTHNGQQQLHPATSGSAPRVFLLFFFFFSIPSCDARPDRKWSKPMIGELVDGDGGWQRATCCACGIQSAPWRSRRCTLTFYGESRVVSCGRRHSGVAISLYSTRQGRIHYFLRVEEKKNYFCWGSSLKLLFLLCELENYFLVYFFFLFNYRN